jgi:hypothetical protein
MRLICNTAYKSAEPVEAPLLEAALVVDFGLIAMIVGKPFGSVAFETLGIQDDYQSGAELPRPKGRRHFIALSVANSPQTSILGRDFAFHARLFDDADEDVFHGESRGSRLADVNSIRFEFLRGRL